MIHRSNNEGTSSAVSGAVLLSVWQRYLHANDIHLASDYFLEVFFLFCLVLALVPRDGQVSRPWRRVILFVAHALQHRILVYDYLSSLVFFGVQVSLGDMDGGYFANVFAMCTICVSVITWQRITIRHLSNMSTVGEKTSLEEKYVPVPCATLKFMIWSTFPLWFDRLVYKLLVSQRRIISMPKNSVSTYSFPLLVFPYFVRGTQTQMHSLDYTVEARYRTTSLISSWGCGLIILPSLLHSGLLTLTSWLLHGIMMIGLLD